MSNNLVESLDTRIYIYDLNNYRVSPDGEPIYWIGEMGRFIGFDEMDYDIKTGNWYVTPKGV